MVRTKKLEKIYEGGDVPVHALRGVNFIAREGELVSILGPSGSGKTTLLNMLGALDSPTSGKIIIDGIDIAKSSAAELTKHRLKIGFVFQSFNLISRLTAFQNVEIPLIIQGVPKKRRQEIAMNALVQVGLKKRIHHKPTQLSGGEMQRVALARALARDPPPKFLLMDEPTGNVDIKTRDKILKLVQKINEDIGATIIIITHDHEVAKIASRSYYIVDGRIYSSEEHYLELKEQHLIGKQEEGEVDDVEQDEEIEETARKRRHSKPRRK
ncbi:MAG TPA: ABC transporter ATP-binding protein [Candidatus Lokiarchaeia archaeon]|nr:ABC transporter ATP-binding protein [Candidatus Lokiarchaeia archaeon]